MLTNVNRKAVPRADRIPAGPRTTSQAPAPIPVKFRGDPVIWAAWLYYRENMTQAEIGQEMGVSRATVNAYISDARARGVVSVRIDPGWLASIELSQELSATYGLEGTLIVPAPDKESCGSRLTRRIGRAGADLLATQLTPGATVGVAWGRTVLALAEAVTAPPVPNLTVGQLTGGTTSTFDFSPEFCASLLAERLKARCLQIAAPAIVTSSQIRSVLMNEPIVKEQFRSLAETDICVFGVCTTFPDSLIFSSGILQHGKLPKGPSGEAIAVIAGRCIAPDGSPIVDAHDARVIGLPLDALRKIRTRIAVAGGEDKCAAIKASLRGGYPTHLVTDEKTAQALLGRQQP